jgi:endonuclease/exonuclease/phosphatase family metal-dependent hydrolase
MRKRAHRRRLLVISAGLLAAACTSLLPETPFAERRAPPAPLIIAETAHGERQMDLRVMTFNVAGLPQPIRRTRDDALQLIGEELREMRAAGTAPHVLVVQEAFTDAARAIGDDAGYAYQSFGPDADTDAKIKSTQPMPQLLAERRLLKGEGLGKILGSGLAIFSDVPIIASHHAAFAADDCASSDCLANKGILLTHLTLPGMAGGLDIATTHMNSYKDAGKPYTRSLIAHQRQSDIIAAFLARQSRADAPLIFAGDFNAAESTARHSYLAQRLQQQEVMDSCARTTGCLLALGNVRMPYWQSSLDLQWLRPGGEAAVAPVKVSWAFDAPVQGTRLSDHKALMVTYRLRWTPRMEVAMRR